MQINHSVFLGKQQKVICYLLLCFPPIFLSFWGKMISPKVFAITPNKNLNTPKEILNTPKEILDPTIFCIYYLE